MSAFVHLHAHSHFSILDSTIQPGALAERVAKLGMDAIAVTDHASLAGAIEFQGACGKHGVRPIFGATLNVVPDATDPAKGRKPAHLVLLARSLEGYYNLVRLTSRATMRAPGENGRPLFDRPVNDWAEIEELRGGLIALSGDAGGEIPQLLLRGRADDAIEAAERYRRWFGDDGFYIEICRHPEVPETLSLAEMLVDFARSVDLPLVATNNVHYLRADHWEAHVVLVAIGMRRVFERETIQRMPLRSLWLKSPDEMLELFADLPEAIENTVRIAEACDCTIPTGKPILPRFPLPEGEDDTSWLRRIAQRGLDERLAFYDETGVAYEREPYQQRLERELGVIESMGFPGYFLIVQDFIQWAHDQGIPVGPGRGSGAGSLVAWVLRITDMDPLPYGLLFERFLNPERVSMPDFDIDFCFNRRLEVVQYVSEKYGVDRVAQIATYGQLKAKAVLRDAARVLNRPLAQADQLAKLIPTKANVAVGLDKAFEAEPRLREMVQQDPDTAYLFEIARVLENVNRNAGVHAAGVVIARDAVAESVPVIRGAGGEVVSAYTGPSVEAAGLVKFDFLGLKTLTVIHDAVALINAGRPGQTPIDMRRVPLDDRAVFDFFARQSTVGIFQMESAGFLRLVRRLRPDRFEDLIALVALYRPGPLQSGMVDDYINVKHGRQEPKYPHPLLEPVLYETYGVMVYQEQVMKSAQVLAGYTLGGADLLRRAMGKKKPAEMEKQRSLFLEGARTNGIDEERAGAIFELIIQFAGYGFNKSHSAVYALLAYHTGWLKTHHPTEFLTSLMTNDASSTAKLVAYINDARGRGIAVRGPDVNLSDKSFTHGRQEIRFGFSAIKGLGDGAIDAILDARGGAPFLSLVDFCERIDARRANRSALEGLALAGALDGLHPEAANDTEPPSLTALGRRRAWLHASLEIALARGQKTRSDREMGQSSLFELLGGGEPEPLAIDDSAWTPMTVPEMLRREKELLGNYVSGHPLDVYRDTIQRHCDATLAELEDSERSRSFQLAVVIVSVRILLPQNEGDQRRAVVLLEDLTGQVEMRISARRLPELEAMLDSDAPVLASGKLFADRDDEGEITRRYSLDRLDSLDSLRSSSAQQVVLTLPPEFLASAREVDRLREILQGNPGSCSVVLEWELPGVSMRAALPPDVRIAPVVECLDAIEVAVGEPCVRLR